MHNFLWSCGIVSANPKNSDEVGLAGETPDAVKGEVP